MVAGQTYTNLPYASSPCAAVALSRTRGFWCFRTPGRQCRRQGREGGRVFGDVIDESSFSSFCFFARIQRARERAKGRAKEGTSETKGESEQMRKKNLVSPHKLFRQTKNSKLPFSPCPKQKNRAPSRSPWITATPQSSGRRWWSASRIQRSSTMYQTRLSLEVPYS